MAVHDNTYKIYELCGLPGLTIEGYTGFAGETGSNIFLGSKTGGSGFNIAAAVDTDNDGIMDTVWYVKSTSCFENDFVLINEYNILNAYTVKYYTEDSSGSGNYNIPEWMKNQLSTSSSGNYLVLEFFDRCIFNISTVNYLNNLEISVQCFEIENEYTGWNFTYKDTSTNESWQRDIDSNEWTQSFDQNYRFTLTSEPKTKECVSKYLAFSYSTTAVEGRNMKIVAQFSKTSNLKNGSVDSVVYDKGAVSQKTSAYQQYGSFTMGYIPNYDASINFDNEELEDFAVTLKAYNDPYQKDDCGFYLPIDKQDDYNIELYVYLQTVDGLEEKIYLGKTAASSLQ